MQISITAIDGIEKPLRLEVSGFQVEISAFAKDRRLVISESDDSISVAVADTSSQEIAPEASTIKEEAFPQQPEATAIPEVSITQEEASPQQPEAAAIPEVSITKAEALPQQPEAPITKEEASPQQPEAASPLKAGEAQKPSSEGLFRKLADLRRRIASEAGLPAYTIFQDKSLHAMCEALPQDTQALKALYGVGEARSTKYGSMFMEVIRQHLAA